MKKRLILEQVEKERIINLYYTNKSPISEQLDLLYIPSPNILFSSGDSTKQIKLSGTGADGRPRILKYNISAKYKTFFGSVDLDVKLRNINRKSNGNLTAEAELPGLVKGLIPDKNKTSDGWLYLDIPKNKIDNAISELKTTKGATAKIDAGHGVEIKLQYTK